MRFAITGTDARFLPLRKLLLLLLSWKAMSAKKLPSVSVLRTFTMRRCSSPPLRPV